VFSGAGAHGAYHAGVLRALQDAGIKLDLVAGHGIGTATAALAAIDGAARLWDANGIWSSPTTRRLYGWKPLLRLAVGFSMALGMLLVVPLLVLALGLIVYPIGFLITLVGLSAGAALTSAFSAWLQSVFAPEHLPTVLPRFVMLVLILLTLAGAGGLIAGRWRTPMRRRSIGGWWWDVLGTPLDALTARHALLDAIWQLIRGAAGTARPEARIVGRRYADVLTESLGQPGFRELITIATDLDARRDVIVAFLREPFRSSFLTSREGRDRRAEVLDLAGFGREHGLEVVAASLTPPVGFDPALVTFGPDSYWRGETHRLCDRPEAIGRLIEELDVAGVQQLILVSGVAVAGGPHRLSSPRLDTRHRLGDYLVAAESIALEQAVTLARSRFEAVYVVAPSHNPLGPFDFAGVYDEASDRRQEVGELMDLGYSDAHRQFIEPVVGASGEQLARNITSPSAGHKSPFTS
jgi:hypothetical protein